MSKVEIDERIDPNSWTTKELVKHLYREIQDIHKNQAEMLKAIEKFERKEQAQKAVNRALIAIGSAVGAVAGFLVKHLFGQ